MYIQYVLNITTMCTPTFLFNQRIITTLYFIGFFVVVCVSHNCCSCEAVISCTGSSIQPSFHKYCTPSVPDYWGSFLCNVKELVVHELVPVARVLGRVGRRSFGNGQRGCGRESGGNRCCCGLLKWWRSTWKKIRSPWEEQTKDQSSWGFFIHFLLLIYSMMHERILFITIGADCLRMTTCNKAYKLAKRTSKFNKILSPSDL